MNPKLRSSEKPRGQDVTKDHGYQSNKQARVASHIQLSAHLDLQKFSGGPSGPAVETARKIQESPESLHPGSMSCAALSCPPLPF